MLYEYLRETGAVGRKRAARSKEIMTALDIGKRELVKLAASEREGGGLICSAPTGGYYLPANDGEIIEQKNRLEKTFVSRAIAVRVFRRACKEINGKKACGNGAASRA